MQRHVADAQKFFRNGFKFITPLEISDEPNVFLKLNFISANDLLNAARAQKFFVEAAPAISVVGKFFFPKVFARENFFHRREVQKFREAARVVVMRMTQRDKFYLRQIYSQSPRIVESGSRVSAIKNKFRPRRLNQNAQPVLRD